MIKIKKEEFVRFLKLVNEMRGRHSARIDYLEKDEEHLPTEVDQTVSMQLTHKVPSTDPEDTPNNLRELELVAAAIARDVPEDQLENFYDNLHKIFQRAKDTTKMTGSGNPYDQLMESIAYLSEGDDSDILKDKLLQNDDSEGVDDSGIKRAKGFQKTDFDRLEYDVDQEFEQDPVGSTQFRPSSGFSSDVLDVDDTRTPEEADIEKYDKEFGEISDISSSLMGSSDPVGDVVYAITSLISTLQKFILVRKTELFGRAFKTKRGKDDKQKISADVFQDPEAVREMLAFDKVIPDYLHEFAIITNYFQTHIDKKTGEKSFITKRDVMGFIKDGCYKIMRDPNSKKAVARFLRKWKSSIKQGDLSQIAAELEYNEKEPTEQELVDLDVSFSEYSAMKQYNRSMKGGTTRDVIISSVFLYFSIAKAAYLIANSNDDITNQRYTKHINVAAKGENYRGKIFTMDTKSNTVSLLVKNVAIVYTATLPSQKSIINFQNALNTYITDEQGEITRRRALEIAKTLDSKHVSDFSEVEKWVYSACSYNLTELLRSMRIKFHEKYESDSAAIYDYEKSGAQPIRWKFLDPSRNEQANKDLLGIREDAVKAVKMYCEHLLSRPATAKSLHIMFRSSKETGGNIEVEVPTTTFVYLAPIVLGNLWGKAMLQHFSKYYHRKPRKSKYGDKETRDVKGIISSMEKAIGQYNTIGPFFGRSVTSLRQWAKKHVVLRYAILFKEMMEDGSEAGRVYIEAMNDTYASLCSIFVDALELYVAELEKVITGDEKLTKDFELYNNDIKAFIEKYSKELEGDRTPESSPDFIDNYFFLVQYALYKRYLAEFEQINDVLLDYDAYDTEMMDDYMQNDRFNTLLTKTTAGKMLRTAVHDTITGDPNAESFMKSINSQIQRFAQEWFASNPEFKPGKNRDGSFIEVDPRDLNKGTNGFGARMSKAAQFTEIFSMEQDLPNFKGHLVKNAFKMHHMNVDEEMFNQAHRAVFKEIDRLFIERFKSKSRKEDAGSIKKRVDDEIKKLNDNLQKGDKDIFDWIDDLAIESIQDHDEEELMKAALDQPIKDINTYVEDAKERGVTISKKEVENLRKEKEKIAKQKATAQSKKAKEQEKQRKARARKRGK